LSGKVIACSSVPIIFLAGAGAIAPTVTTATVVLTLRTKPIPAICGSFATADCAHGTIALIVVAVVMIPILAVSSAAATVLLLVIFVVILLELLLLVVMILRMRSAVILRLMKLTKVFGLLFLWILHDGERPLSSLVFIALKISMDQ